MSRGLGDVYKRQGNSARTDLAVFPSAFIGLPVGLIIYLLIIIGVFTATTAIAIPYISLLVNKVAMDKFNKTSCMTNVNAVIKNERI